MSNQSLTPLPTGSSDSPELTEAEIQAILDNLAIPENMTRQAANQAQGTLRQGDALLDAMHGGAVDLSAGAPGPDVSGEVSTRETGLDVVPDIVELRRQLARELFPDGDASPAWESASPGQTAPAPVSPVADPAAEIAAPAPIPYVPSMPIPAAPPAPTFPQFSPPDAQPMVPDAGGYSSYRVLQTEIAALYGEVREVLAPEQSASKQARALLSEASIMLKGQPDDLDVVEDKVRQVRNILRQATASQQNADTYGRPILIYLSAWLLLSLGAIIYFYLDGSLLSSGQGIGRHFNALIITLFWGAIGGVLSATHSLWWHTSEAQDYDHRFNASYVVRPVIGMILGGLIYAIIAFAFDTISLDLPGNLLLGLIPSLLALIAGFRSGQLLRLVGFSPNVT